MLRKIKKVSRQLNKASKIHKRQSNALKKIVKSASRKRKKK
jgi:hypothetical protein